jgi:general secretion pathway protein D
MRAAFLLSAVTLMTFVSAAFAADDTSDSSSTLSAPVAQGVDVQSIIASVSQRTHKKFLIDPRVRATVNLVGTNSRDVTYPLLLTILAVHGFAVYEQEGVVVVTPDANERFFPSSIVASDDIRAPDAEVVTTIIVLKNAKAPQLATVLRPIVYLNASVQAMADRNALIIVDRAANVRRLVTLVHDLDKLPPVKTDAP